MYALLVTETRRTEAEAHQIVDSLSARVHQFLGARVLPPAGPRCLWTVQALFMDPGPGVRLPQGCTRAVVLEHLLPLFVKPCAVAN